MDVAGAHRAGLRSCWINRLDDAGGAADWPHDDPALMTSVPTSPSPPSPRWPTGSTRTTTCHDTGRLQHEPAERFHHAPPTRACRCIASHAAASTPGARSSCRRCNCRHRAAGSTRTPSTRPPARCCCCRANTASPARVLGIGDPLDPMSLRARAVRAAAGRLAPGQRPRCRRARRPAAGLGPGRLPLQPLQAAAARAGAAAARSRRRRDARHARRLHARARPGQHADRAHGPGPARTGVLRDRRTPWRDHRGDHRRRPARAQLPGDPRRRPRLAPRAAPDRIALGQRRASARRAGRQGRVLRHRRPRHQDRRRHAQHEEGHGRRRARDRAGANW